MSEYIIIRANGTVPLLIGGAMTFWNIHAGGTYALYTDANGHITDTYSNISPLINGVVNGQSVSYQAEKGAVGVPDTGHCIVIGTMMSSGGTKSPVPIGKLRLDFWIPDAQHSKGRAAWAIYPLNSPPLFPTGQDADGAPLGIDLVVNTGMSITGPSLFGTPEQGDMNGDGKIDGDDLTIFAASYGSSRGDPNYNQSADLNGDGKVDILDLGILADNMRAYNAVVPH